MRHWAWAALAGAIVSAGLPKDLFARDGISLLKLGQHATSLVVGIQHSRSSSSSSTGIDYHASRDPYNDTTARIAKIMGYNVEPPVMDVVIDSSYDRPNATSQSDQATRQPRIQDLDMDSAEALIRKPHLSNVSTRRKPDGSNDERATKSESRPGGALESESRSEGKVTSKSETSSAAPIGHGIPSGKKKLLEMTACLALVSFVFATFL